MEFLTASELWRRVAAEGASEGKLRLEQFGAAEAFFSGIVLFIFLFFLIAILIAVWVYKDAKRRGENGALWLLIVLLTGLIGLIIWLIVRPPERVYVPVPPGYAPPHPGPAATSPGPPPSGYYPLPNVFCPACNAPNTAANRYCAACGARLG